jgi:hypothetical protein
LKLGVKPLGSAMILLNYLLSFILDNYLMNTFFVFNVTSGKQSRFSFIIAKAVLEQAKNLKSKDKESF